MTFHDDLAVGKAKERLAIPLIIEHYKAHHQNVEAWLNPAKAEGGLEGMRRGDIFDSYGIRWEIKYDRRAAETGNIYLEHAALQRSGADYVLFFVDGMEPLMMSKDALLVLIQNNLELEPGMRKYKVVQSEMANEGTLLPLKDILNIGKHLLSRPKRKVRVYAKKKRQFALA